jgi:hypothetical protein
MNVRTANSEIPKLVDSLVEASRNQEAALADLLEILKRERDALKEGKAELIPGLLSELQEGSSRAMGAEAERDSKARRLAEELGCRAVASEICTKLEPEERGRLRLASRELMSAVSSLKEINFILSRQADEHRQLAEMVLDRLRAISAPSGAEAGLDTMA